MRSDTTQMDIYRDRPATAEDYRLAAAAALNNPFESPEQCRLRAEHYIAEAERLREP